jgi:mannose/fructose/N-acetylgalactosamine-specific phosphotransferase system component IID
MQNVGFAFTIKPFLKFLYKDKTKLAERLKAHFGFFNTHPYLANLLIGIVMRLEENYYNGEITSDEVIRTKTMLAGPVAALGDRLIWSTWRVFCGIVAVSLFLFSGKDGFWYKVDIKFVVLLYLILYNLIHIPIRFFSIYWGYKYSSDVIQRLSKFSLKTRVLELRRVGIILLLLGAVVYTISFKNFFLTTIFWLNIFLSLWLSKKYSEVVIFSFIFIFDVLIFIFFNKI